MHPFFCLLPLFIVFRALGVISDKDILALIVGDLDSSLAKKMMDILLPSIIESSFINTQKLALDYLKKNVTAYGKNITDKKEQKI